MKNLTDIINSTPIHPNAKNGDAAHRPETFKPSGAASTNASALVPRQNPGQNPLSDGTDRPLAREHAREDTREQANALRHAVLKLFKKISLNYAITTDWHKQEERIREWVMECLRHHVTPAELMAAYHARTPSRYPPSASELIAIAKPPLSDDEVISSLKRTIRAAYLDDYASLNDAEWWAFNTMDRYSLLHGEQRDLVPRWRELLSKARLPSFVPLPRPTTVVDQSHRLGVSRSEEAKEKGRQTFDALQELLGKRRSHCENQ